MAIQEVERSGLNGNGRTGQLRSIAEALPMFHQELSKATEDALRKDPQSRARIRTENFLSELSFWGNLQGYRGIMTPEQIERETARKTNDFSGLRPEEQIDTHRDLADSNNEETWKIFKGKVDLMQLLLRESGEEPETLEKAREVTYRMFKHMPKFERISEFGHMDSAIRQLLVAGFPIYLAEYEKMIAGSGAGEAGARDDAAELQRRFEVSDDKGKFEMAKDMREKVKEEPIMQFSGLMERYVGLVTLGVIKPDKRGFISEQEWIDKFNEAQDPARKAELLRVLNYVISKYESVKIERVLGNTIEHTPVKEPEKAQSDEEFFLEAVTKGVTEDKDALGDTIAQNLDLAVKQYEKSLKSRGMNAKEARRLALQRKEAIVSEIFGHSTKAGFISKDRPKDLAGALNFMLQFVPKKQLPEGSL